MSKHLPKHEFTLLADDIRMEIGNKPSIMGVYGDSIIVASFPVILPKLFLFSRLSGGKGDYQVRFSLKNPDGVEQVVGNNEAKITMNGSLFNMNYGISPFQASQEGDYTYTIFIDGKEFCKTVFNVKAAQPA